MAFAIPVSNVKAAAGKIDSAAGAIRGLKLDTSMATIGTAIPDTVNVKSSPEAAQELDKIWQANEVDREHRATRLFGLISSNDSVVDPRAGLTARGQLLHDVAQQQTANAANSGLHHPNSSEMDAGERSGNLQKFLRNGIMANEYDNWFDRNPDQDPTNDKSGSKAKNDDFTSARSNVKTAVQKSIEFLDFPFAKPVSTGAGMVIDWVHSPDPEAPGDVTPPTGFNLEDKRLAQDWSAWAASKPTYDPSNPEDRRLFDAATGQPKTLAQVLADNAGKESKDRVDEPTLRQWLDERMEKSGNGSYEKYREGYEDRAGTDDNPISMNEFLGLLGK